ncbi:MAG: hypothetical protein Alis3KO_10300 [Aliiglaciecola sp.]
MQKRVRYVSKCSLFSVGIGYLGDRLGIFLRDLSRFTLIYLYEVEFLPRLFNYLA